MEEKKIRIKLLTFWYMNHVKCVDSEAYDVGVAGGYLALEFLVLEKLPNLIRLSRKDGESVFQRLSALIILYCDNLEPLTEQVLQGMHSLKILVIASCDKFNFSAGFQYLTSLERLDIAYCPEVEGFPEALQHMTSLQSLKLSGLPNLRSLPHWLGNLTLLRSLDILDCPKLMCLPMSIQCLSALKILNIERCPKLEKRCKKEIGEDWPKIAYIPHIRVNDGGV